MRRFFLFLSCACAPLLAANEIIVIYGASCSGKSTLSKAIAEEFGVSWRVIDRDEVIDQYQDEERADECLFQEIQNSIQMGLNVVVDTQNPMRLLRAIEPYEPLMVFVYAKLPFLIKRDEKRSHENNREAKRAFYARSYVYNTFAALITTESTGAWFVDRIKPSDIPMDLFTFNLHPYSQKLFYILAQAKEGVAVYTKYPCDVIVKSHQSTVRQSVEQIWRMRGQI